MTESACAWTDCKGTIAHIIVYEDDREPDSLCEEHFQEYYQMCAENCSPLAPSDMTHEEVYEQMKERVLRGS